MEDCHYVIKNAPMNSQVMGHVEGEVSDPNV